MIKQNGITIGISGSDLDKFKQEQINEFQDKRITWQGEENVLVTTVLQRIYEFAAGKVQILLSDTLPQTTEPNTQYWVKTYDGSTLEDGRHIIMTDYLNNPTYIGTSSVDLTEYYTKTETDDLLEQKQDLLGNDTAYSSPSDADNLSDVNISTKKVKRITFSNIWSWIVGKLTANTEKGIQVSNGKLGHTNSITPPSTGARIISGVLDSEGHFTGKPTGMQYSDVYSSSTENQLFTRKGANAMYSELKATYSTVSTKLSLGGTAEANANVNWTCYKCPVGDGKFKYEWVGNYRQSKNVAITAAYGSGFMSQKFSIALPNSNMVGKCIITGSQLSSTEWLVPSIGGTSLDFYILRNTSSTINNILELNIICVYVGD